jgi:hypothetical protein
MRSNGVGLSDALAHFEKGVWSDTRPYLTDFASAETFREVVGRREAFEDLVSVQHGIHTHRVQWYVVAAELGSARALELSIEAVQPHWKDPKSTDHMWDMIVDASDVSDLTKPENMHAFLRRLASSWWPSYSAVGKAVTAEHEGHAKRKAAMRALYPRENRFTDGLRDNIQPHWGAAQKQRWDDTRRIEQTIRTEAVRDSGYRWTGWIPRAGAQGASDLVAGVRPDPYFVPTVAYPEAGAGATAEEAVDLEKQPA